MEPTLNHLATNDHVLAESPLQSPSTYADLQSASQQPTTGIVYAYGIRPDHLNDPTHPSFFFRGQPNAEAAVAVIALPQDTPLTKPAPVSAMGNAEVLRRIQRDAEVLLAVLVRVDQVVPLPPFNLADIAQALDAAAKELVAHGVAT